MSWKLFKNIQQNTYLAGATPTKLGPRPLYSDLNPSVCIICLETMKIWNYYT